MAFEGFKRLRLAADADTPPDMLTNVGTLVAVPQSTPTPTTSGSELAGIPGYARTAGDGTLEWVMAGTQDELLRHISRVPPEGSWADLDARRVWRRAFDDIRGGVNSSGELKTMAAALYSAARADMVARGWTAPA